jgi:hypothetical protein
VSHQKKERQVFHFVVFWCDHLTGRHSHAFPSRIHVFTLVFIIESLIIHCVNHMSVYEFTNEKRDILKTYSNHQCISLSKTTIACIKYDVLLKYQIHPTNAFA